MDINQLATKEPWNRPEDDMDVSEEYDWSKGLVITLQLIPTKKNVNGGPKLAP